ncbi:hypothetical protein M885DRAFT_417308, partial [Pelagophyceae sp. CCMP2097]
AKPAVVFAARAQPGAAHASWAMRGLLAWLASSAAHTLLAEYDVVVAPLLNPDGVAAGNARTSVAGVDLDRRWARPRRDLEPEVF